jgi:hypothetical protein
MLKIVSKFAMDILPSVVATIIGAYIVNHYIVTKPDSPVAAAVSSADATKADAKADAKPSSSVVGSLPQPGVTAKGISEKAMIEHTAAERPAVAEKPAEKSADRPTETASIPADTRRHAPAPREKVIAKSVAAPVAPVAPSTPAAAPVVAAPAAEATPEDHRDANELARAAIERLRGAGDGSSRSQQEAARVPDAPRVASAPPVAAPVAAAPAIRALPPPIMVSTPAAETPNPTTGSTPVSPARIDDPRRPTPPADIPEAFPSLSLPSPGPLDLRAEAAEPQRRERTNVAQDMLMAAKSVFHAVLPK